jgi:hypothetical protein
MSSPPFLRLRSRFSTRTSKEPSLLIQWLDRPRSQWWCVASWVVATAIFVGVINELGGLTEVDAFISSYSSWSIAHANVACAFPPGSSVNFPVAAPLYSLVAGGFAALFRVGHGIPFPNQTALGHSCLNWSVPMTRWSFETHALTPTLRFGYVGWIVLAAGIVAVMRSCGRGRNGWEPAVLIAVAFTPPVAMCLEYFFHPQDLLAMGLILLGVSSAQRNAWVWTGVLMGLAFTSQQFAILPAALLFVLVPAKRRLAFSLSAVAVFAAIVIPLVALSDGRALRVALTGSGEIGPLIYSVPWELHLTSSVAIDLLRVLPVIAVVGLALWARRRLSNAVMEPMVLLSLLATSLALRLIFEGGLFGYYFMASAVAIVLLDFVRRTFRLEVILWLAVVALVFTPLRSHDPLTYGVQMWVWQLVLVPPTVALAVSPLVGRVKRQRLGALLAADAADVTIAP